jgi:hypothetical protein
LLSITYHFVLWCLQITLSFIFWINSIWGVLRWKIGKCIFCVLSFYYSPVWHKWAFISTFVYNRFIRN